MFVLILILLLMALIVYSIFITFYAIRWAKIIFSLEDKYSEALEIHDRTLKAFDNFLKMQMFFESPAVKQAVAEVMDDLKLCRAATTDVIATLTEHSKQKYYLDEQYEE